MDKLERISKGLEPQGLTPWQSQCALTFRLVSWPMKHVSHVGWPDTGSSKMGVWKWDMKFYGGNHHGLSESAVNFMSCLFSFALLQLFFFSRRGFWYAPVNSQTFLDFDMPLPQNHWWWPIMRPPKHGLTRANVNDIECVVSLLKQPLFFAHVLVIHNADLFSVPLCERRRFEGSASEESNYTTSECQAHRKNWETKSIQCWSKQHVSCSQYNTIENIITNTHILMKATFIQSETSNGYGY